MKLTVLGSTGSVGRQALCVASQLADTETVALCAGSDAAKLEMQVRATGARFCALYDEEAAKTLKTKLADTDVKVYSGSAGICEMISDAGQDTVLNSIVGVAGLMPTMAAADAGADIALANKESLVCAGSLVCERVRERGVRLIPVDSEHSAIYQCLAAGRHEDVRRILLTASGGPFFSYKTEDLLSITPEKALSHPTWSMGKRISVDSATLMNKGFEMIEAFHLFGVGLDRIRVIVHRESVVHSMVEFNDGCVIAQLAVPDMAAPIRYALTGPDRSCGSVAELDLTKIGSLSFADPDEDTFFLLRTARTAAKRGGIAPAVMNGADEAAVRLFLEGRIGFHDIFDAVTEAVENAADIVNPTIDVITEAGKEAYSAVMGKYSGRN